MEKLGNRQGFGRQFEAANREDLAESSAAEIV